MSTNTEIKTRNDFYEIINNNKNVVIIKLGAEWCPPCKAIKQNVHTWFEYFIYLNKNVQCYDINIDKNPDFVSLLKKNRIINGIPAILVYYNNNKTIFPNDFVGGGNIEEINMLFNRIKKNIVLNNIKDKFI
jgi:thiol-disulfide isomerase/thioredoxin